MPTTRRRTARRQGSALPNHIRALFEIGCGWNTVGDDKVRQLWAEHGQAFLKSRRLDGTCFAETILGAPNEQDENQ